MDSGQKPTIEEVIEKHRMELLAIQGVHGFGVTEREGTKCIVIYVDMGSEYLREKLPQELDGYPVVIEMTDEFKAL